MENNKKVMLKKLFAVVITVAMLVQSFVFLSIAQNTTEVLPGDVNLDGSVNAMDANTFKRAVSGAVTLDGNSALAADITGDGKVNSFDANALSRILAGTYVPPSDGDDSDDPVVGPTDKPDDPVACTHTDYMLNIPATEPDCTKEGNISYWVCTQCGTTFADEDAQEEIAESATVVAAKGHTEVIDPAVAPTGSSTGLTEGAHCSVCGTVTKAQEILPKLEGSYHSIIYRNLKTAEYPEITEYEESAGLLELPTPEADGYVFVGWYTASVGGDVVDYIKKGSTEDYILYAHWELETYDIIYWEAPEHSNVESYNVETRVILQPAKWSGLKFMGWQDQNGNIITEIPKGTSGDLELTATWKLQRNLAVQGTNEKTLAVYDETNEVFYYIYEIGTIEHVVLDQLNVNTPNLKYHTGAGDLEFGLESTVTIENSVANSIANTVSESVSSSDEWEESKDWAQEKSEEHNVNVTVGVEVEMGVVTASVEAGYGYTNTTTSSWGGSSVVGGSTSTETGKETESSSELAYLEAIETTVTATVTIEKDMPEGYYSYVHAGNVRVFGVVTYVPETGNFKLSTYSMLDNMHEMVLYYPDLKALNSQSCETLEYKIPRDEILAMVESAYYVEYDANGGEGAEMKMSVNTVGESIYVLENEYTREGYTFGGWELRNEEDGSYKLLEGGATVEDICGEGRKVLTLYAHWINNDYTVQYNANQPAKATHTVANVPANQSCRFDEDVTLGAKPTLEGWIFRGWYLNAECSDDAFLGWDGEVLKSANLASEDGAVVNVYAKWVACLSNLTYDANGGTVTNLGITVAYDRYYNEFNFETPVRDGYVFYGWKLNGQLIDMNSLVQLTEDQTIVADWVALSSYVCFSVDTGDRDKKVTEDDKVYDRVNTGLDRDKLLDLGYSVLSVKIRFDCQEVNDGYQDMWFYTTDHSKKLAQKVDIETADKYDWYRHEFILLVDIADLGPNCEFDIEWGANGSGKDTWNVGFTDLNISVLY